jgi:hypothetical protein
MNANFGPGQTAVAEPTQPAVPATPVAAPATPAPAPSAALTRIASPGVPAASNFVLGDHIPDFADIILPRINIAQGIGALKDTFTPGSVVLGRQTSLFCPPDVDVATGNVKRASTPPTTLTVLGFRPTRFCEKVQGGVRGLIVASEDEVRANGGTLDYKEWKLKEASGMKRFDPLADALVLIERPASVADDDTVFVFDVEGKKYALALWGLRGVSYTAAAKGVFFTHRVTGCLRGGYPTHAYDVTTRLNAYPGNKSAWVPVCVPKGKNSAAFLDFVRQILGGGVTPPSVAEDAASQGE